VNSRPSVSEIYEDGDRRDACPTGQTRTRGIIFDCMETARLCVFQHAQA
jgi:hypothetical protein